MVRTHSGSSVKGASTPYAEVSLIEKLLYIYFQAKKNPLRFQSKSDANHAQLQGCLYSYLTIINYEDAKLLM